MAPSGPVYADAPSGYSVSTMSSSPVEVIVLRGLDGYMAVVVSNGECIGFYTGETSVAATSQAALAITSSLES